MMLVYNLLDKNEDITNTNPGIVSRDIYGMGYY